MRSAEFKRFLLFIISIIIIIFFFLKEKKGNFFLFTILKEWGKGKGVRGG